jgi:uncharacterized SAM-binding protein YcdF (DUF218 family)
MLGKKYVFESKATRLRRLLISGVGLFAFALVILGTFIVYIPIYAKLQKERAADAFFQKSPDAIAVFTGDKGRIAYAVEQLKKNPSSKLLISGVYAANSFQTLIDSQAIKTTEKELEGSDTQVDLDYESKNTFENVRETVEFLRSNPQLQNVLIISSDYHIMRIKLIMSHFITSETSEFYFDSVLNDYDSWSEMRKLLKESVKIVRTFFILKILREDRVLED